MSDVPRVRGYTVERQLGRGASGEVWQARVVSSGAPVALKRIAVTDDEQRRRAQAEAALLAALEHPNLIRLHALVPADDAVLLVLDLADGGSLADLLAARGRLTPGEVITAVAPVAAALAYLHGEGVVHADVSAANVLFTAAGVPLLADVGVARIVGDDSAPHAPVGYVDPAVAGGCIPGPPSDVFMLAGVALHALTGAPTWPPGDPQAALALAARGVLDDVGGRLEQAAVPPAMAAVLLRALSVDPARRGTAADLALDLRHSGRPVAVELGAGRGSREPAPARQPPRQPPRHAASAPAARPAFVRPVLAAPEPDGDEGPPPPTRMVGARPRPVVPRPAARPAPSRRAVLGIAAGVAVALLAALGWWLTRSPTPSTRVVAARTSVRASSSPASSPTSAASPAPGRRGSSVPPSNGRVDWAAALHRLDALRARAFATRDPRLLRRVYLPGPLLHSDAAYLERAVPPGCGLAGARTRYGLVRVAADGPRVILTVIASLPPSELRCSGRPPRAAAGVVATRLRLELVRTSSGLRIADQRPA